MYRSCIILCVLGDKSFRSEHKMACLCISIHKHRGFGSVDHKCRDLTSLLDWKDNLVKKRHVRYGCIFSSGGERHDCHYSKMDRKMTAKNDYEQGFWKTMS